MADKTDAVVSATPSMAPMKLAFYTYSYTEKLDMPIATVLEAVAAAGYDGIDLSATRRAKSKRLRSSTLEFPVQCN